jgi:hypothetical protein
MLFHQVIGAQLHRWLPLVRAFRAPNLTHLTGIIEADAMALTDLIGRPDKARH